MVDLYTRTALEDVQLLNLPISRVFAVLAQQTATRHRDLPHADKELAIASHTTLSHIDARATDQMDLLATEMPKNRPAQFQFLVPRFETRVSCTTLIR